MWIIKNSINPYFYATKKVPRSSVGISNLLTLANSPVRIFLSSKGCCIPSVYVSYPRLM